MINLYLAPTGETGKVENLLKKNAVEFNELKRGEDGDFRLMILFKD